MVREKEDSTGETDILKKYRHEPTLKKITEIKKLVRPRTRDINNFESQGNKEQALGRIKMQVRNRMRDAPSGEFTH